MDLEFGMRSGRVICADAAVRNRLLTDLSGLVTDEPAALAFELQTPIEAGGLFVVLDRSGFVLARVRSCEDAVAVIKSHLDAFGSPPPAASARIRTRSLLSHDGSVTVLGFPIAVEHPLIERRMDRLGVRLIDRLALDIDVTGRVATQYAPWNPPHQVDGHCRGASDGASIARMLVPNPDAVRSPARRIAYAASMLDPSTGDTKRIIAERLAMVPTVACGVDPAEVYATLKTP